MQPSRWQPVTSKTDHQGLTRQNTEISRDIRSNVVQMRQSAIYTYFISAPFAQKLS